MATRVGEQVLLYANEIQNPIKYFENAEKIYTARKDTDSLEMMSKAVEAFVLQRPEALDEALELVERMPEGCLQRNYAIRAIALCQSQTDTQKAHEIANRIIRDFCFFAGVLQELYPEGGVDELTDLVVAQFPNLTPDNLEMVEIVLMPEEVLE